MKVLSLTEYRTIKDIDDQRPSLEVPKYHEAEMDDDIGPDTSDMNLSDSDPEESEQLERQLAREMAGDSESTVTPEETSSVAPEEAAPEIIPVEEPSDQ